MLARQKMVPRDHSQDIPPDHASSPVIFPPGRLSLSRVEMQAAAGVEPQIDIFGWVREYVRGAVHTQPVTLSARRDGSNATIAFLGEVDAVAADVEISLAGGFSAAVIPLAAVTP